MKKDVIGQKYLGELPLFNPVEGKVIFEPDDEGHGSWIGGPSVCYDSDAKKFYMNVRCRKPIGKGRGWQTRTYESSDGINFNEIWHANKEEFNSSSIERSWLMKTPENKFRLYTSYSALKDNRWRIDMMEADQPSEFNPKTRVEILGPEDIEDCEGIKDPVVINVGGMYYLFAGYGLKSEIVPWITTTEAHSKGNCFATPYIKHPSGMAVSPDGIHFQWKGKILEGGPGFWDQRVNRVSLVLYVAPIFYVFYDGRHGINDAYQGRTGYYISTDLEHFQKVTVDQPVLESPFGTGGLRYLDAVVFDDKIYYYYEFNREDESHELRLSIVKR
jgi:hypothetical protein